MLVLKVKPQDPEPDRIAHAASVLAGGGLVAFPTETVYGVAARADLPAAMARLRALKTRPEGEPFTLHLGDPAALPASAVLPDHARRLMDRFWPGPLTLVLPLTEGGTVGARLPAHPVALALLRGAGGPVLATSANPRGKPPPASAAEVVAHFPEGIDCLLDGGKAVIGQSSSVIRIIPEGWEILREGLVSREMVARAVSRRILFVCTGNSCRSPMAKVIFDQSAAKRLGVKPADLPFHGVYAESAGTSALPIGGASPWAQRIAKERGGDLSRHVPTPLVPEMLARADAVYAMSRFHLERIRSLAPSLGKRARLLSPDGAEMVDPIGGGEAEYRACADHIARAVETILESCLAAPRPVEMRGGGKR